MKSYLQEVAKSIHRLLHFPRIHLHKSENRSIHRRQQEGRHHRAPSHVNSVPRTMQTGLRRRAIRKLRIVSFQVVDEKLVLPGCIVVLGKPRRHAGHVVWMESAECFRGLNVVCVLANQPVRLRIVWVLAKYTFRLQCCVLRGQRPPRADIHLRRVERRHRMSVAAHHATETQAEEEADDERHGHEENGNASNCASRISATLRTCHCTF